MLFSALYVPTLKESPAEAEVISHKLLLRAGMIRKLTSGLYSYLPLGLRTLKKIEAIVREEMDAAGFLEVLLPMVQPADLWKETGRWEHYGRELLRFTDRNDRDYCLGPTHEEVMTDLVRGEVKSYRQLPLRLYQLHTKFRDEMRPRFGLMRGREFVMKDGYSYDCDETGAKESYELMRACYTRIFTRLGLRFRAVEADTGSIGGNFSHEFMVLADSGEDTIAYCKDCNYAANVERAVCVSAKPVEKEVCPPFEKVATPKAHTVEEVSAFLHVPAKQVVKTMLFKAGEKTVAALVRGDHEVNDVKLARFLGVQEVTLCTPEEVVKVSGAPLGFAGPVDLACEIYADSALENRADFVTGANAGDTHLIHVDLARDCNVCAYADLRTILADDPCPHCGGRIGLTRGIEVGHIFMLGTKYSAAMHASFLNENGEEKPMIMGCYGIGISRIMAAAIEQNHDQNGILFPPSLAPFRCILVNLDVKNKAVTKKAQELHDALNGLGIEVLLDDRDERAGVKFKDADLLGIPLQLVLGKRSMEQGVCECTDRRTREKGTLPLADFSTAFLAWQKDVLAGWQEATRLPE